MNTRLRNKLKATHSKFVGHMRYLIFQWTEPDGKVIETIVRRLKGISISTPGMENPDKKITFEVKVASRTERWR